MTAARIEHILLPVDGSACSFQAVRQAAAVARWSGAAVTALYVDPPPLPDLPLALADRAIAGAAEQRMREWLSRAACEAGISAPPELMIRTGSAASEILHAADTMSADLIVLGTHGLSGLQHLLLGSVTEKVLRRARCPVLTVPAAGTVKSRLPFERILCAIDFSDWSLRALEYAITATLGSGASLTLAHVLEWPWLEPPPPNFAELPVEEATALAAFRVRRERSAHARLELFEPEGLKERCHIRVVHGRAHDQLLHIAAEENADLIVVGVHGRVGLDLALFGSTANQLVRHATCPVLTVRH